MGWDRGEGGTSIMVQASNQLGKLAVSRQDHFNIFCI